MCVTAREEAGPSCNEPSQRTTVTSWAPRWRNSSDTTVLRDILGAASETPVIPTREAMEEDVALYAMEPLFIPGVTDRI
jgi:hypothetical protein